MTNIIDGEAASNKGSNTHHITTGIGKEDQLVDAVLCGPL